MSDYEEVVNTLDQLFLEYGPIGTSETVIDFLATKGYFIIKQEDYNNLIDLTKDVGKNNDNG